MPASEKTTFQICCGTHRIVGGTDDHSSSFVSIAVYASNKEIPPPALGSATDPGPIDETAIADPRSVQGDEILRSTF